MQTVGNFWVDLTRSTIYVLLPIAFIAAIFLVWQGVPQNLGAYVDATTLEGGRQVLSQGPAASQIAIKQLGTNGGGFWNANSSVPYENPTALSNFVEVLFILLISAALTHTFGRMVKNERAGWAIYAAMSIILVAGILVSYWAEAHGNPNFAALGLDPANMEGKEVRFGLANSSLWEVTTTAASNGSVNAMHDSFTPLGGMIAIIMMELGEIIFGGVGSGLYGMLLMVIIAVFIAGLMVGRTPEYLGKKIEAKEVKMAMLAILILPLPMLAFTAISVILPFGLSSIQDPGPHGFSEVLYLFTSQTANNGSAFAGFTGNTLWYNTTGGLAMLIGRYFVIIPMMAVAGSLVAKKIVPPSAGTLPTTGGLFVGLLVGVILIIGGLTFFPALSLGPDRRALRHVRRDAVLTPEFSEPPSWKPRQSSASGMPVSALADPKIIGPAIGSAFAKLDPRAMMKNPVMFVVEIVAALTTVVFIRDLVAGGANLGFTFQIILWLWITVLFANFAEAVAEGRGKAQADSLRRTRTETHGQAPRPARHADVLELVPGTSLRIGDIVLVEAGDIIPSRRRGDRGHRLGQRGGDHRRIGAGHPRIGRRPLGGHRRHPGALRLDQGAHHRGPGSTFLDRMIRLVEGAERQKTPNEIALNILLAGMTIIFVFATATIPSFADYAGGTISIVVVVALFVTLIPTTIGALLSAIGIAGMDRLVRFNVLAMSGRAVEAAGDVDTLLLDKTGTITLGNRQATEFKPLRGVTEQELADAAQLASLADETPEGRSIVVLAKEKYGIRGRELAEVKANFIPFTAQSRMSGVEVGGSWVRKGAVDAILGFLNGPAAGAAGGGAGRAAHPAVSLEAVREINQIAEAIAKSGGTPLAVAKDGRLLGVVHLKDIVKGGIRERFAELRRMGIRTIMITGDNPMTAAAIAAEAGVDDFLAQATPEDKLRLIRDEQAKGKLVAMCGDGTNDAPALAQADVGVAMNTGTVRRRARPATWSTSIPTRPSSSRSSRSASSS